MWGEIQVTRESLGGALYIFGFRNNAFLISEEGKEKEIASRLTTPEQISEPAAYDFTLNPPIFRLDRYSLSSAHLRILLRIEVGPS